ncbi:DUF6814 family protein [Arcticibacter tournemirensis]|uniref:Uncharacterized protein n=1 Tax=Arcticibacter tournemirensis TaxID=699437 RepID=A0A4Q0M3C2_9SPHI|nr:hypothetical protein [Arcticibacter tournemirensis]RXF67283.1 hypothetical protein EKH83_20165 [Arcticibacter tournemirensis]
MNTLKKYLGIIWVCGGVLLAIFLSYKALAVLSSGVATAEDYVFWSVIIVIFIPIIVGFILFGYYAWKGEYGAMDS